MRYKYFLAGIFALIPFWAFSAENINRAGSNSPYIPTILIVEDDDDLAELENQGAIIWHRRSDMALALLPRDMSMPSKLRAKVRMERGRRVHPAMDTARPMFDADKIGTGEGLPQPYTGKGVVVGFCDIGFEPNNIAFLDENGKSRVKRIVYYDEPEGVRTVIDDPDKIARWTTDDKDEFHGTHVAGILTGSFTGAGYQGIAPEAEIVATTSQLYDCGILSACEDIIEYAQSVGKPAVINLSLASFNGPHDGTSLFCRYMDLLAEDAIVCLAAGNEGNRTISKRLQFSDTLTSWRVRGASSDWTNFHIRGMVDAWSADTRPVGFKIMVFDDYENKMVYEGEAVPPGDPYTYHLSSDDDEALAHYIKAEINAAGYISELNGRWVTEIEYDTLCDVESPNSGGKWSRYRIAFEFTGKPGTYVDICTDGAHSWFSKWPGETPPVNDLSVSDLTTGYNTICVGMYATRDRVPTLGGEDHTFSSVIGNVSQYSSYGTLLDGRQLPHTAAPGAPLISACNSYYVAEHPEAIPSLCAVSEVNGKKYYWVSELGTSMSTPFTVGVIATWLQADPTLDVHAVRDIILQTNYTDCLPEGDPRSGQGWLRPYEGLKRVIENAGVTSGTIDVAAPTVVFMDGYAEILNLGGNELTVSVFAMDGTHVLTNRLQPARIETVNLSNLASGIYLMKISSPSSRDVTVKFRR